MDTGFPDVDSKDDFARARRRQVLALLSARMRGRAGDLDVMLPFDEVVAALGRRGQRELGVSFIPIDSIVGSVDRVKGFDRRFRPTSAEPRRRFERLAAASRRGEEIPPIDVYRVGGTHFVKDGHHRVSVARALGYSDIAARVTEVMTELPVEPDLSLSDLPLKGHARVFFERVPLAPEARRAIQLSDPWDYAMLAEGVEAWGFRVMQARGEFLSRAEVAEAWFRDEYQPVVALLRESGLMNDGTPTENYLSLAAERYRILRTHNWDDGVIERLRSHRS